MCCMLIDAGVAAGIAAGLVLPGLLPTPRLHRSHSHSVPARAPLSVAACLSLTRYSERAIHVYICCIQYSDTADTEYIRYTLPPVMQSIYRARSLRITHFAQPRFRLPLLEQTLGPAASSSCPAGLLGGKRSGVHSSLFGSKRFIGTSFHISKARIKAVISGGGAKFGEGSRGACRRHMRFRACQPLTCCCGVDVVEVEAKSSPSSNPRSKLLGAGAKQYQQRVAPVPLHGNLSANSPNRHRRCTMLTETTSGEREASSGGREQHFESAAVIVSDLSGFTSGTRMYGIVHAASRIVRKRQLCLPIVHAHGAHFVGTEGDNLIVVLPDAFHAVRAAVEMCEAITTYNASLPEERHHHRIALNGVGVHCGGPVVVDRGSGEVFGPVASLAYHIGEDLCEDGRVLVSSAVVDTWVDSLSTPATEPDREFRFERFELDAEEGDLAVHKVLARGGGAGTATPLPSYDDGRFLHPSLLPLAARHMADEEDLTELDTRLSTMLRPACILMFRITEAVGEAEGSSTADALRMRRAEESCLEALRPILRQYEGDELEPCLWCFDSPVNAVRAALAAARKTREKAAACAFGVAGFGVHSGELLLIRGTDVHWGDPVNTASKLGQDLAEGGQLLVSEPVHHELLENEPEWVAAALEVNAHDFVISKVQITAYELQERPASVEHV